MDPQNSMEVFLFVYNGKTRFNSKLMVDCLQIQNLFVTLQLL